MENGWVHKNAREFEKKSSFDKWGNKTERSRVKKSSL